MISKNRPHNCHETLNSSFSHHFCCAIPSQDDTFQIHDKLSIEFLAKSDHFALSVSHTIYVEECTYQRKLYSIWIEITKSLRCTTKHSLLHLCICPLLSNAKVCLICWWMICLNNGVYFVVLTITFPLVIDFHRVAYRHSHSNAWFFLLYTHRKVRNLFLLREKKIPKRNFYVLKQQKSNGNVQGCRLISWDI